MLNPSSVTALPQRICTSQGNAPSPGDRLSDCEQSVDLLAEKLSELAVGISFAFIRLPGVLCDDQATQRAALFQGRFDAWGVSGVPIEEMGDLIDKMQTALRLLKGELTSIRTQVQHHRLA